VFLFIKEGRPRKPWTS